MSYKRCSKCKVTKPRNGFSRNRAQTDGLQNTCRDCGKEADKAKGIISKGEAISFVEKLTAEGIHYTCDCCGGEKLAEGFYHKRSRGKVSLVTSKCKGCQREYQRLKTFGVSPKVFDEMLAKQGNKCGVCGIDHDQYKSTSHRNKCFAVDHCHATGDIRGLLCDKCNRALGYFKDSKKMLLSAIHYLEK